MWTCLACKFRVSKTSSPSHPASDTVVNRQRTIKLGVNEHDIWSNNFVNACTILTNPQNCRKKCAWESNATRERCTYVMEDWSRDGGVKVHGALSSGYGKKFWVKDRHGDNDETYHELLALAVADHVVCSSPGKDQVHNVDTDRFRLYQTSFLPPR